MLEVEAINSHYGESHILRDASLKVDAGECVAILGRNGAGKTTTLKTILGYVRATTGSIMLDGEDITTMPTYRIVRKGIGYVPENRGIFRSLTVHEHFAMSASLNSKPLQETLDEFLALFPRLAERIDALGDSLSGGEQQMLSIARALVSRPKLLILDEPSEGLAPVIIEDLEQLFVKLSAAGQSILIVEQNYHLATVLANRVYVLGDGSVRFEGTPVELEQAADIKARYIGI